MPHHEFLWTDRAIEKVEDNGLTVEEVEYAVRNAYRREESRNSPRDVFLGFTPSGERICVPFDEVDAVVIAPVTAFKT
jgi:hypothetical protein